LERSGESAGTGVLLPASGVVEKVAGNDVLGDGVGGGDRREGAELICNKKTVLTKNSKYLLGRRQVTTIDRKGNRVDF